MVLARRLGADQESCMTMHMQQSAAHFRDVMYVYVVLCTIRTCRRRTVPLGDQGNTIQLVDEDQVYCRHERPVTHPEDVSVKDVRHDRRYNHVLTKTNPNPIRNA